MPEPQTFANFGHRPLVGGFKPDMRLINPKNTPYGLPMQIQWIYAFLRDESGAVYAPERKFIASLTGGLFFMTDETGTLNFNPKSGKGTRGELRRTFTDEFFRWDHPMWKRMPEGTVDPEEQGFFMEVRADRMEYKEGNILDLAGPNAGLGMQFYSTNPDAPLLYTSMCYWLEGEVLGKKVEGPIFFDNVFWPHGEEWKEYRYFNDLQVGWHVFANKFKDGTIEWGHQVNGRNGFNPGIVINGDKVVAATPDLGGEYHLEDKGFVTELNFDMDGHQYQFLGDEKGWKEEFSLSRSQGKNEYRAQYGETRRKDDQRELHMSCTWLECFADRIRDSGFAAE
jgi:hypothetical protein